MEKSTRDRARSRLQQMTNRKLEKLATAFDISLVRDNGRSLPRKQREEACMACDELVEMLGVDDG